MFDIGWQELFVIGLVAIIVVGPKDLPRVLRAVTLGIRKIRGMARDFQDGIEELAREADLQDLRKEIEQASDPDLENELRSIADPDREVEASVREIGRSLDAPAEAPKREKAAPAPATAAEPKPEPEPERIHEPKPEPARDSGEAGARKAGEG